MNFAATVFIRDANGSSSNADTRLPKRRESAAMDKNRVAGSIKEIKGAAKEAAGKAVGDAKLRSDGNSDQAEGEIQNAVGGVNDAMRGALAQAAALGAAATIIRSS
jgi:uncharacterized protein YjbJ (UPF0337 family)